MGFAEKRSINNLIPTQIPTFYFLLLLLLILPFVSSSPPPPNGVFRVHHKFSGKPKLLNEVKAHDTHRHSRILAAIDIPLGGDGNPTGSGLYYTKIGLGSPPKEYYVQVDTGSDVLWVNCIECATCKEKESHLGIKLTLYDPRTSVTAKVVTCEEETCAAIYNADMLDCSSSRLCRYKVEYADGSATDGYYVQDTIVYPQVSGNSHTIPGNGSVLFGCGDRQTGDLGSSLDGLLGFGKSNYSVLSQLANSGKVKKVFSHCLDSQNGGGLFTIGEIVEPKFKTTPLVADTPHYNVNLKGIAVGKDMLDIPTDTFESGTRKGTVIDSGTTLAYLPDVAYTPLIKKILSDQPDLKLQTVEDQYQCFEFDGSVDDGFPTVTFHFEDKLSLTTYPHDYLFKARISGDDLWCIGWQNAGRTSKEGKDMTLLGDIVLSNKLVVYDLDNGVIGWTEYNCSSSVKMLDEKSGHVYSVNAHDISSSSCVLHMGRIMSLLLLFAAVLQVVYF